jgi:hypothetical protein
MESLSTASSDPPSLDLLAVSLMRVRELVCTVGQVRRRCHQRRRCQACVMAAILL